MEKSGKPCQAWRKLRIIAKNLLISQKITCSTQHISHVMAEFVWVWKTSFRKRNRHGITLPIVRAVCGWGKHEVQGRRHCWRHWDWQQQTSLTAAECCPDLSWLKLTVKTLQLSHKATDPGDPHLQSPATDVTPSLLCRSEPALCGLQIARLCRNVHHPGCPN